MTSARVRSRSYSRSVSTGDDLRGLMRRFPSGVAVLTIDHAGERVGLTVGSILSLSLSPPLVGVAVGIQAAMHELLRDAGRFALSLLAGDQERLAQHFARGVPPLVMWDGIELEERESAAPLLAGALGWIDCALVSEVAVGDHTLFIGGAERVERGRVGAGALVHVGQEFHAL